MPDSSLPTILLHGQVARQHGCSKPRTVWSDVVLSDVLNLKLNHYMRDARNQACLEGVDQRHRHLRSVGQDKMLTTFVVMKSTPGSRSKT